MEEAVHLRNSPEMGLGWERWQEDCMCCENSRGIHGKIKEKGSRNEGLQNEGEGQLPDMIARIWGRSQTDPLGFFQHKNISYTFAESNNVIEQCCNTEDLELKMSYFITLQWQRVALQGVTKPTRHWVLRRCTFSLHLAVPWGKLSSRQVLVLWVVSMHLGPDVSDIAGVTA